MANGHYSKYFDLVQQGSINLLTDTIKATLIDTTVYTVNLATHDYFNDIPGSARIATTTLSLGKGLSGGAFDADDISFPGVTGPAAGAFVLWKDTGTESTSPLISYTDTATGLPTSALSANTVNIAWDGGTNKIFRLG